MHPSCYVQDRQRLVTESLKYPLEQAIHSDELTQYVHPSKTDEHSSHVLLTVLRIYDDLQSKHSYNPALT